MTYGLEGNTSLGLTSGDSLTALPGLLTWLWKVGQKLMAHFSKRGMYEVLEFQTTLTIHDPKGCRATLTKYEKVRFLQDNIIAYRDRSWGDGKILQNYQCTPGEPVDVYRNGHQTYVLISLRTLKNKGDIAELNCKWNMTNCFLRPTGFWGTDINHQTTRLKVQVIFPKSRPPKKAMVVEENRQKEESLEREITLLPGKCSQITWEKANPKLYEHYVIKWQW